MTQQRSWGGQSGSEPDLLASMPTRSEWRGIGPDGGTFHLWAANTPAIVQMTFPSRSQGGFYLVEEARLLLDIAAISSVFEWLGQTHRIGDARWGVLCAAWWEISTLPLPDSGAKREDTQGRAEFANELRRWLLERLLVQGYADACGLRLEQAELVQGAVTDLWTELRAEVATARNPGRMEAIGVGWASVQLAVPWRREELPQPGVIAIDRAMLKPELGRRVTVERVPEPRRPGRGARKGRPGPPQLFARFADHSFQVVPEQAVARAVVLGFDLLRWMVNRVTLRCGCPSGIVGPATVPPWPDPTPEPPVGVRATRARRRSLRGPTGSAPGLPAGAAPPVGEGSTHRPDERLPDDRRLVLHLALGESGRVLDGLDGHGRLVAEIPDRPEPSFRLLADPRPSGERAMVSVEYPPSDPGPYPGRQSWVTSSRVEGLELTGEQLADLAELLAYYSAGAETPVWTTVSAPLELLRDAQTDAAVASALTQLEESISRALQDEVL